MEVAGERATVSPELHCDTSLPGTCNHRARITTTRPTAEDQLPTRTHGRGKLHTLRVVGGKDHMGKVGVLTTRVDRDLEITCILHRLPVGPRHPFGWVAIRLPWVEPVHVVRKGVKRITTGAGGEGIHIHHRAGHDRPLQLGWIDLLQGEKDREWAFRLITVSCTI